MSLKGKVAVVTGSTSGIGLAMAEAMAGAGADVLLNGFGDADAIAATVADLAKTHGVTIRHHGADMSKPDEIAAMIAYAESELGGVDILINNAGIQHTAPIDQFPPAKWEQIIAINLSSAFYGMHHALPIMRKRGWGRIINTASAHGLVASANKAAYVAAKHGIVGLTKVGALETAEEPITVNAICPGWVRTPLVEKQIEAMAERDGLSIEDAARKLLSEKQPSKSFVTPEQIGALALFLTSDAAAQITGIALPIDGGWTAQ